ncbi:MAG TPA: cysteine synthase family protein [Candidatus Thermoplasmatota archaeon]|nr:cysteine synthase family protein [Candidatus Thermoplasmatota archaeon]
MSAAHADPGPVLPDILAAVGRTPMVRLARLSPPGGATVWAKCEHLNPGGSAKDRIALGLVERAERDGTLPPGGTIVEASSGNTAIALAQAAAVKGYRCVIVVPEKVSEEKRRMTRAFGAEVVVAPKVAPDHPQHYRRVAKRLARETGGVFLDQFANPAATDAHYLTTGPEIHAQLGGRVDAFVAGAGTGGTIAGVARYLKEKDPAVRVVLADPPGSLLSGPAKPYLVEGIGVDFHLPGLDLRLVDEIVTVPDAESFAWARRLAREEGILAGGSSGSALAAAVGVAAQLPPDANVVAILADTGRNYLSKLYDDAWLARQAPAPVPGSVAH